MFDPAAPPPLFIRARAVQLFRYPLYAYNSYIYSRPLRLITVSRYIARTLLAASTAHNMESAPETFSVSEIVKQSKGDGRAAKSRRPKRWWQRYDFRTAFEFGALIVMIAIVWALLSLPVLFYYLEVRHVFFIFLLPLTLSVYVTVYAEIGHMQLKCITRYGCV